MKRKQYVARLYLGAGRYRWIGRFDTKRERDRAKALALIALERERERLVAPTCEEYAARFLADYERSHKSSSTDTARGSLRRFRADFGHRPLNSISRLEAKDWVARVPRSAVPVVVTLFAVALEDELVERNPFRELGKRTRGRAETPPPTEAELDRLLLACQVHGHYAPMMRALIRFAAYSAMRPGELFELRWSDIDHERMRIVVGRRVYRGTVDLPKSGKSREIALTPPARDAILGIPRTSDLVFCAKRGGRLSQPTLSGYWAQVTAAAGLDMDFYLSTRHYCAHYLWVKLGLPARVVQEQLGHADDKLLRSLYGHGEVGALDEIDAAFSANVVPIRALRDVGETHGG